MMEFSSRNGKKNSKRVNTDDTVGIVSQYFEELIKNIGKVFRSKKWTHRKYVFMIFFHLFFLLK